MFRGNVPVTPVHSACDLVFIFFSYWCRCTLSERLNATKSTALGAVLLRSIVCIRHVSLCLWSRSRCWRSCWWMATQRWLASLPTWLQSVLNAAARLIFHLWHLITSRTSWLVSMATCSRVNAVQDHRASIQSSLWQCTSVPVAARVANLRGQWALLAPVVWSCHLSNSQPLTLRFLLRPR